VIDVTVQSNDDNAAEKKMYNVPDFQPGPGYIIEIRERDGEQNPVKKVEFNYSVDGGEESTDETDDEGNLRARPNAKQKIDLALASGGTPQSANI
jgi:hypothetical protein